MRAHLDAHEAAGLTEAILATALTYDNVREWSNGLGAGVLVAVERVEAMAAPISTETQALAAKRVGEVRLGQGEYDEDALAWERLDADRHWDPTTGSSATSDEPRAGAPLPLWRCPGPVTNSPPRGLWLTMSDRTNPNIGSDKDLLSVSGRNPPVSRTRLGIPCRDRSRPAAVR